MQNDTSKITYGAMMIAMFTILLAITFYIPLMGSIVLFFIPLPIILYRLRYDRISALLVVFAGFILSLLIGGINLLPFAASFGLLGFIIGDTMAEKRSKLYTFMASGLAFMIIMIVTYIGSVIFFGINIIEMLMEFLREIQQLLTEIMLENGELPGNFSKQIEDAITLYETSIPAYFIIGAFGFSFIIVVLNSKIANRLGHKVPKFPPFREMKLPSITVWLFLVTLILPLVMEIEQGTTLNLTYVNASIILRVLFLMQGISLIHYYMSESKLPRWATVIATILALLLSPATVLLGVLDSGMNIRAFIGKDKGN